MKTKEKFNKIIDISLLENVTNPEIHFAEEAMEAGAEVLKRARYRENNAPEELSDMYFQFHKLLKTMNLTEEDLMQIAIDKTAVLHPHMMEAITV